MAKIGLFGGSFNPIHNGHINLAVSVKNELKLDKVIFIPSGTAPHKSSNEYVSAEERLEMCRLALEEYDDFEISDYELCRQGKSYTVYTCLLYTSPSPRD